MKVFHLSDVLTVTTDRLVSNRGIEGAYDILSFLMGDTVLIHQLSRAKAQCDPWLKSQFPQLHKSHPFIIGWMLGLDNLSCNADERSAVIARCVEALRTHLQLPEHLPVYQLPEEPRTK